MRKGCHFLLISAILIGFSQASQARQLGSQTWSDGNPTFSRSYDSTGVQINGVVELVSSLGQASEPDSFSLHLTGIDATYRISQQLSFVPEDFNRLPDIDLYLVTDAFSRRVLVIRPQDGFELGDFKGQPGTPEALERPVAARAFLENGTRKVIITDQGSHRVLKFDYDTRILEWVYGTGVQGNNPGQLAAPSDATPIPDSSQVLICDAGNNRILLVQFPSSQILWTWGEGILNDPADVEWAADRVLVTDRGNHRVLLVDRRSGNILWQFGTGTAALSDSTLNMPIDAQLLPDSTVLIADAGNERLIQVDFSGNIVWRFLGKLPGLKSAFRLADGKTLVISNNELKRLGYSTETFTSAVHDLNQSVNYDSLRWVIEQPAGTQAKFQIRSANSLGDLAGAPWLGPTGPGSFYTSNTQNINPAHDGHRFFQYQVEFSTNDPLLTPILRQVTLHYHFFRVDRTGIITSPVIQDSTGVIITTWENLKFNTILPSDPTARDDIQLEVRILDAATGNLLQSFPASNSVPENIFILSGLEPLKAVQAIRLQAVFLTNNSAVSPILDEWSINWQNTPAEDASIAFTTPEGKPTHFVRAFTAAEAGQSPPGTLFLTLIDKNVAKFQNAAEVDLKSTVTGDSEHVTLELKPTGEFVLSPGLPAVIQGFVVPNNGLMEVADRDTVRVRYVDPTTPTDIATDSVIVLQYTTATLRVENARGEKAQNVAIGDTLFLHITGELDHDLTPAQDSLWASLFDNVTDDQEDVLLLELPSAGGQVYSTGEFLSPVGVPLRRQSTSADNDGFLQTLPGHQIGAQYTDNENLIVSIQVRPDTTGGPPVVTGTGAFDFLLAPNPFSMQSGQSFRLRICAFTGDLVVEKVDIYNLAGDRVRSLVASDLALDAGPSILAGSCSISQNWWDGRTEAGTPASSGTYWARFSGQFTDATGRRTSVHFMRKFILIR